MYSTKCRISQKRAESPVCCFAAASHMLLQATFSCSAMTHNLTERHMPTFWILHKRAKSQEVLIWPLFVQPPPRHGVLRWGIFESIGIFAVSVSGHSSLPVLRNSMKQPQVSLLWHLSFGLDHFGCHASCLLPLPN